MEYIAGTLVDVSSVEQINIGSGTSGRGQPLGDLQIRASVYPFCSIAEHTACAKQNGTKMGNGVQRPGFVGD